MSILKVARMGHPILRAKSKPLDPASIQTPPFQQLIDDMIDTMIEYQGIGLAAPQVHESVRLFVAGSTRDEDEFPLLVAVNPELTIVGAEKEDDWEGCLSIPDVRGRVPRSMEVRLRGFDRRGKRFELVARDFQARVFQHEFDHLDGILFLDRMKSLATLTFMDEYGRFWRKDAEEERE
jgi:peptide deformylase